MHRYNNMEPETLNTEFKTDIPHLTQVVEAMFTPATSATDADEFLLSIDIAEAINPMCDFLKQDLFKVLNNLGFKSITIEGNLYWLICNK